MSSSAVLSLPFAEVISSSSEDDFVPFVFTDDHEDFPPLSSMLSSGGCCDWELVNDNDYGDDVAVVYHNNNDDGWARIDRLYRTFAEAAASRPVRGAADQKPVSAIRFRHGLESQKFHPCNINGSSSVGASARRRCGKQQFLRTMDEDDTENEIALHAEQRRNRKRKSSAFRRPFTEKATQTACR